MDRDVKEGRSNERMDTVLKEKWIEISVIEGVKEGMDIEQKEGGRD